MFRTVGFVPVIAGLVAEMGSLFPAYLYGYMWLEKNSDSQFSESFETLPERLGVSRSTIRKWAGWLCDHGYLIDLTPAELSKPHVYQLTDKVSIEISVQATMWVTKNREGVVAARQPGLLQLDNHDHDMMHDHGNKSTEEVKQLWEGIGFDLKALPKMMRTWEGNLSGLAFCLEAWLEACAGNWIPESWGAGLVYKKIAEGQLPPEKPRTFGDEVREAMEYMSGAGEVHDEA